MDDFIQTLRIVTDRIEKKHRAEVAREIFGRQILRLEIEEAEGAPIWTDLKLQSFGGMRLVTGPFAAHKISRTRELLSDGNDDVFLTVNQTGSFFVGQRGTEVVLQHDESIFSSCDDLMTFRRSLGLSIGVRIPRAALAHVPNIDDRINRPIPQDDEIMRLLRGYIRMFEDGRPLSRELTLLAATHMQDLVALSLGARRDFSEVARRRGLAAARLRAIKASIQRDLTRHDLNITTIAAQHRVTPRHVQRLFENEGQTFSQHVQGLRLALAHAMLRDPGHMHRNIGEIIYDCGFGDVSYFNRMFRRRYGASPTEVRNSDILDRG